MHGISCRRLLVAFVALASWVFPARADDVAEFYKGKTITIIVAHEAATGFDVYARAFGRFLARRIPGNPGYIVQNMPGAGGVTAAAWLYNIAPKDGTTLGTIVHAVMLDHQLGDKRGKYEAAKFAFIGNMERSVATCVVTAKSGISSLDDLMKRESIFGGVSRAGALSQGTLALINLLGAKIKLVEGYKGSADLRLAMQRGEIEGMCGIPVSTLKSQWREDVDSGNIRPIVQLNDEPRPELKGTAHLYDHARSPEDRQVFDLIFGALVLGRIYLVPPGVPEARIAALRRAFDAAIADPEFLAEAAKAQLEISPQPGAEVAQLIERFTSAPQVVINRARQAIGQEPR
jgi:tripartite-type tricarboxylate transporter receptor subunit TctC